MMLSNRSVMDRRMAAAADGDDGDGGAMVVVDNFHLLEYNAIA